MAIQNTVSTPWYAYPAAGDFGQTFSWATYPVQGEDVATPFSTPITAIFPGKVVNTYYDAGGGQVVIQSSNPQDTKGVPYYWFAHLDQIQVNIGQNVSKGTQIGLSGGQNQGGTHPAAPNYSSGPHVEFGLAKTSQIPYTPATITPDLNPDWILAYAKGQNIPNTGVSPLAANVATACQCPPGFTTIPIGGTTYCANFAAGIIYPCTSAGDIQNIFSSISQFFDSIKGIEPWLNDPLRIAKLISGVLMLGLAIVLLVAPQAQIARAVTSGARKVGIR